VAKEASGGGIGRSIVTTLEQEARENGLQAIFAFTYVTGFFARLGFLEVERGELPLKVWKDCLRCPKFHQCDEVAVLKRLSADAQLQTFPLSFAAGREELVQLRPAQT
jgi:amino-acid N-acetyltransferase